MKRRNIRSKSWLRGNVSVFGKTIPVFVLAIALSAAVGFALLTTYVTTTGEATVQQSVVLEDCHFSVGGGQDQCTGETETTAHYDLSASGGDTRDVGLELTNRAEDTSAGVDFVLAPTLPGTATLGLLPDNDVVVELWNDYDTSTETCAGSKVGTFTTQTLTVSDTIPADTTIFYCLKHIWAINAEPGTYSFDVDINPA